MSTPKHFRCVRWVSAKWGVSVLTEGRAARLAQNLTQNLVRILRSAIQRLPVVSTPPKRHAYSNEDDCTQQHNQG